MTSLTRQHHKASEPAPYTFGWKTAIALIFLGFVIALPVASWSSFIPRSDNQVLVLNPKAPQARVIYGHLHMMKTAGTTLNGRLAAEFDRVCGHKGYSYDVYQAYRRVKKVLHWTTDWERMKDSVNRLVHNGFNRIRVPREIMQEIGFENCDYVSHEIPWYFWPNTFQNWSVPLELHVPCRDPIGHLMSMCNYRHISFNCSNSIPKEIHKCLIEMQRFSKELVNEYSNIHVKCFPAQAINEYIDYMEHRLQKRRIPAEFVFRATNDPRNKSEECIWKNETAYNLAYEYLVQKQDYFAFCEACMASQDNLLI